MAQKTPMRWVGTTKLTSPTTVVSFSGTTTAATGYNINLQAADSTAMDVNQGGTWRTGFRIYFRALVGSASNSMYYGSYPYVKDPQNAGNTWDRQGMYWSGSNVPTNTSAGSWSGSPTYYMYGANFTMCDQGATGASNWRYGFQSNTITSSLAESDSAFEHGYIDYMFNRNSYPAAYVVSSSIRPYGNSTAQAAPLAVSDNYGTGGTSSGGSTTGPYQIDIYSGANFLAGSTFVCYAWDSKDINE